ncbi:TRAP transporter large permease subunit, partial [Salipiger manganoxidans]|uniref:TRAP transporter large permease subunit n=2 Tax=Salipiger TaxID=263377 RepID=UPI001E2B408B
GNLGHQAICATEPIYTGIFSPIESSAVGAGLAIVLGFALRRLTLAGLWRAILGSGRTTATVMLILISAYILNPFISLTGVPHVVGEWLAGVTAGPITTLVLILLCYLVLGCFLEGLSMIVLTMPILYPIVIGLGFDPIWYGVIIVIVLEMAMISPPVGVNVFIVRSIAPRVPLAEIFLGVLPFWVAMILLVGILILFPALATYLPDRMMQWGFKCCLRKHRSF